MTTTENPTDVATLTAAVDTNLAAYGNPDPPSRRDQLDTAWRPDGQLVDPPLDGAGVEGIDALMAAVQSQFSGHTFRRTSALDTHHGFARYSWALVGPDGQVAVEGLDVAEFDDTGRLARIVGFMGPLPEA